MEDILGAYFLDSGGHGDPPLQLPTYSVVVDPCVRLLNGKLTDICPDPVNPEPRPTGIDPVPVTVPDSSRAQSQLTQHHRRTFDPEILRRVGRRKKKME